MKAQFFLLSTAFLTCFAVDADQPELSSQIVHENKQEAIEDFTAFTGKINTNKVRMRVAPDVDSTIVRMVNHGKLLVVIGEVEDFFAVQPPQETKLYVYSNFIDNGVIKGNNINVRLSPDLHAPIVAKLQEGDQVIARPVEEGSKWVEIEAPLDLEFFIAKEFVDNIGGVDHVMKMQNQQKELATLMQELQHKIEDQLKTPFEKMEMSSIEALAEKIAKNFSSFEEAKTAKDMLHKMKENYLSKKIAALELQLQQERSPTEPISHTEPLALTLDDIPLEKQVWHKKEFDRFLAWSSMHEGKSFDTFVAYEKDGAILIKGTIEAFETDLENVPGNYLLIQDGAPVAYLYSLDDSLEENLGKEVSFLAQPRENLDFAFPAYIVLEVQ